MSLDSDLPSAGFQVKYLGSVSFVRKKRQPLKGIVSLQRPLLELYTGARRRGENHRSVHPLALTQQLEVCDYGLVVAEGTSRGETVVTKVITPLSNVVLWASVRFHARIIKKRVFGAAFVPLACSDGVLDHKSYVCLASKQRFLVSLTHPSVFACIYRSVQSPTTFQCHAFVCATQEDALAVAAYATAASRQGGRRLPPNPPPLLRRRIAASLDSGTDYYSPSENNEDRNYEYREESIVTRTDTEEESNSYASVVNKNHSPCVGRRGRFVLGASSPRQQPRHLAGRSQLQKRFLHHREARALIGKYREPPRPLPPDDVRWEANPQMRRNNKEVLDEHPRSTSSYDRDDPVPSDNPTVESEDPPRYRNSSTMTERDGKEPPVPVKRTEVLAETIDLSSETGSSLGSSSVGRGEWRPVLPATEIVKQQQPPPLVKYTYFGYETYAKPTQQQQQTIENKKHFGSSDGNGKSVMGAADQRRTSSNNGTHKGGVIEGNGTGKVTINVPYRPSSRASSSSSRTVPHGVRSFHKSGHVRNWSSLSQTSASSSSSTYRGTTLPPRPAPSSKVIRWSSEDRLPRRQQGGFFFSLKRIGMQSLTKAKHKTGKFISSMKTRIMGPKRSSADGSEDSAYDTSEVCLSPSGRQGSSSPTRQPAPKSSSAARRQQSWSFHDLRTAAVERPTVRSRNHNLAHRRKHRRRRKAGRSSSSSDSGVEAAYHSDNSARKSNSSEPGRNNKPGVTRVKVQHGMGTDTFQRWSHTNLQDELGYIP